MDLATDGKPPEVVDPIDGHSLVDLLSGNEADRPDEVMIEFVGEGVFAPGLILRKDDFKYVHCGEHDYDEGFGSVPQH